MNGAWRTGIKDRFNWFSLINKRTVSALLLLSLWITAQTVSLRRRAITHADLPRELSRRLLPAEPADAVAIRFARMVSGLAVSGEERVHDGEFDHLIYFILQSRSFTSLPLIEPALSAAELVRSMNVAERRRYLEQNPDGRIPVASLPESVRARISEFVRRVADRRRTTEDERLGYFLNLTREAFSRQKGREAGSPDQLLRAQYFRAMRFLYLKEFESGSNDATGVARLYRQRAHSTDTRVEANYAVFNGLGSLRRKGHPMIERVLIVGPGHDIAPRTGLIDSVPPQSFQPFAVADALLSLGLSDRQSLRIDCVDINPRVVSYLRGLGSREVILTLFSGIEETPDSSLTRDYREYFLRLGSEIGNEEKPVYYSPSRLVKRLRVSRSIAGLINADRFNIVTERYDPSPGYDLVVATNILTYFRIEDELPLALANLAAMMSPGAALLHNELTLLESDLFTFVGLPVEQVRTLLIARNNANPFYDGVVIHRKK